MTFSQLLMILGFTFGGGGLTAAYMTLRKASKENKADQRERILREEMSAAKGAGLLITTSSEAINVFNVALRAAQEDLSRRDALIDKLEDKVARLEARVRELEGKSP